MKVDVAWDGVELARAVELTQEGDWWFLALPQPLPVGTRLALGGDANETAEVARVREGSDPGMWVTRRNAATSPTEVPAANRAAQELPIKAGGAGAAEGGTGKKRRRSRKSG